MGSKSSARASLRMATRLSSVRRCGRALVDPVSAHAEALPEYSHAQARQPTRLAYARLSQRRMSADASSLV
jgi:hypothetical protein